jgi:hypothetical protein
MLKYLLEDIHTHLEFSFVLIYDHTVSNPITPSYDYSGESIYHLIIKYIGVLNEHPEDSLVDHYLSLN